MTNIKIDKKSLDSVYEKHFNAETFKSVDPCGIVHELMQHTTDQLDIEIGALFVAMISWGNRKAIRSAAKNMLCNEMKWQPSKFIFSGIYKESYKNAKNNCVYRTLNIDTFKKICETLQYELKEHKNLEEYFNGKTTKDVVSIICKWLAPAKVGTIDKSACKRICMFTRWMTRKEEPDFNIWQSRSQSDLYAVMDVHICNFTHPILLNKRPTWKACEELTNIFKSWNADDPLKYDLALMTLADINNQNINNP